MRRDLVGDVSLAGAEATLLVGPDDFAQVWSTVTTAAAIGVAAEHTGMAAHLLETTTAYLLERHQFGRAIGSFQAIKHRLADLLVDLESPLGVAVRRGVFDEDPDRGGLAGRGRRGDLPGRRDPRGPRGRAAARRHRLHLGAPGAPLRPPRARRRGAASAAPATTAPPSPSSSGSESRLTAVDRRPISPILN